MQNLFIKIEIQCFENISEKIHLKILENPWDWKFLDREYERSLVE